MQGAVKELFFMKKSSAVRKLALCSMLVAMSTVIGIICKNLFTMGIYHRITFENLPVIFASVTLGPIYGAVIALASDFISCICSTNPMFNPLVSLGAICVGFFSGIGAKVFRKSADMKVVAGAVMGHFFGQVIVKSIAKILYFGMPWWGIAISVLTSGFACFFEILTIRLLLQNRAVSNYLEKLK